MGWLEWPRVKKLLMRALGMEDSTPAAAGRRESRAEGHESPVRDPAAGLCARISASERGSRSPDCTDGRPRHSPKIVYNCMIQSRIGKGSNNWRQAGARCGQGAPG